MFTRRSLLLSMSAVAALRAVKLRAESAADQLQSPLDAFFDRLVHEQYALFPEMATFFGLDGGPYVDLRSKVTDRSTRGREAARTLTLRQLAELKAYPRTGLTVQDQVNLDVAIYTRESAAALQAFDFGVTAGMLEQFPYTLSHLRGTYLGTGTFLSMSQVKTTTDADSLLARFSGSGKQIDDEGARVEHEAGIGVVPPDFIMDQTIARLKAAMVSAADSPMVKVISDKAHAAGLSDHYATEAVTIHQQMILPALQRQLALLERLRPSAQHQPGLWRLKEGSGFYAAALHSSTTTSLSPEAVHRFGVDQAGLIKSRMDGLLRKQGMSTGTVGERMAALARDPKQIYPNTDEGKSQLIEFARNRLTMIEARLPQVFRNIPKLDIELKRVPPELEGSGPVANSELPPPGGGRPGVIWINLKDSSIAPKYGVPSIVYHEGCPGHMLEAAYSFRNKLPLIRKLSIFSGFGEGWALYSEQLAAEIGMYEDDPFGELGYLQGQLLRANRCVVDTGLHAMRWSRERAIEYLTAEGGDTQAAVVGEVDRYCVMPGQACAYKIGQSVFNDLRTQAKSKLGTRFDIQAFHEMVLSHGHLPLDLLKAIGKNG